jgi:hypothetical protein
MPQNFSWSFSGGAPSGVGVNNAGALDVDAMISAEVTLVKAMAADRELDLQIDDVDKVAFLVLTSSLNDGSVEVKADTATRTKLTGPIILYGAAVKLFAGNLDAISLRNTSASDSAEIEILMGLKLA